MPVILKLVCGDVIRTVTISNSNNLYGDEVGCYEIEEVQSLDIDAEFDFEMGEFIMKKMEW
jgi:CMP-N-acetylneuraminic acid synthetase